MDPLLDEREAAAEDGPGEDHHRGGAVAGNHVLRGEGVVGRGGWFSEERVGGGLLEVLAAAGEAGGREAWGWGVCAWDFESSTNIRAAGCWTRIF